MRGTSSSRSSVSATAPPSLTLGISLTRDTWPHGRASPGSAPSLPRRPGCDQVSLTKPGSGGGSVVTSSLPGTSLPPSPPGGVFPFVMWSQVYFPSENSGPRSLLLPPSPRSLPAVSAWGERRFVGHFRQDAICQICKILLTLCFLRGELPSRRENGAANYRRLLLRLNLSRPRPSLTGSIGQSAISPPGNREKTVFSESFMLESSCWGTRPEAFTVLALE